MKYKSFEEMSVWQKAKDLAVGIFGLTEQLPRREDYGLTSQIRRSALSISANIAEAFGRHHSKDKVKFYYNSRGSLAETKSHLIYSCDVKYFNKEEVCRLMCEIEGIWKELNCLIKTLSDDPQP